MTQAYTSKLNARHILIIVSGIMMTFGCSALVFSTWSAFQAVVPDLLGVDKASWAAYITILYFAEAFSAPFIGKLMTKYDIRLVLSASVILVGLGFILISIFKSLWIFYLAGILMGLGEVGLMWLAVPTLCSRWFNQKSGTIIGLCMAFTGIGGAFWLQVFNFLYQSGSGLSVWTIYLIWGIVALASSLPFTLFAIRKTPQEAGTLPYGLPQTASGKPEGVSAQFAFKSKVFYSVFFFAGVINLLTIVAHQLPSYTKSLVGVSFDPLAVGVMMATVMMASQAISKLALGAAADKNTKASFVAAIVSGVLGILLVWFGTASPILLYSGAAIYGFFFAACMVLVPVVVQKIFGTREYAEIYARISMFVNIFGGLAPVFWAYLGGFSYSLVFGVALVLLVLVFILGSYSFAHQEQIQEKWTA